MLIKILYLALIQASTVFSKIPLCNNIQSEKSVCSLSENYNPGFPGTVALTPQNLDSFIIWYTIPKYIWLRTNVPYMVR